MLLKALDTEDRLSSGSLMSDDKKWRIGKLKVKIIIKGLPVRFYRDPHELGELLFKDWLVEIEKLDPATFTTENIG